MARPIGLVLAGGRGERLGRAKGELRVDGRPLAEWAADALTPLCRGILISIAAGGSNPAPGHPAIEDPSPAGRGPLAGIQRGFELAGDADLLVLACDYPRVTTPLLARLLDRREEPFEIVLPRDVQGRLHPLVALWRRSTEPAVNAALARERLAVKDVVAGCRRAELDATAFPDLELERALLNVNTPEDLQRLRER